MVARRHNHSARRIIGHFKGRATQKLTQEGIHPLAEFSGPPTPWARGGWFVHLDDENDVLAAIEYVSRNPLEAGLPSQKWSFVKSFWTDGDSSRGGSPSAGQAHAVIMSDRGRAPARGASHAAIMSDRGGGPARGKPTRLSCRAVAARRGQARGYHVGPRRLRRGANPRGYQATTAGRPLPGASGYHVGPRWRSSAGKPTRLSCRTAVALERGASPRDIMSDRGGAQARGQALRGIMSSRGGGSERGKPAQLSCRPRWASVLGKPTRLSRRTAVRSSAGQAHAAIMSDRGGRSAGGASPRGYRRGAAAAAGGVSP